MNSFVIGKVVEPEMREFVSKKTGELRRIFAFGVLSGRNCEAFDVFDNDKAFEKVQALKEGSTVVAVVGSSVDDEGKLRVYLNGVGPCPAELRSQLLAAVKG